MDITTNTGWPHRVYTGSTPSVPRVLLLSASRTRAATNRMQ